MTYTQQRIYWARLGAGAIGKPHEVAERSGQAVVAAINAANEAALAEITRIRDERVDDLARWALTQAIDSPRGQA